MTAVRHFSINLYACLLEKFVSMTGKIPLLNHRKTLKPLDATLL